MDFQPVTRLSHPHTITFCSFAHVRLLSKDTYLDLTARSSFSSGGAAFEIAFTAYSNIPTYGSNLKTGTFDSTKEAAQIATPNLRQTAALFFDQCTCCFFARISVLTRRVSQDMATRASNRY
jgi:hypothetical protein